MEVYKNFIGIDIGNLTFVVGVHGRKKTKEYENNLEGIHGFMNDNRSLLATGFSVL